MAESEERSGEEAARLVQRIRAGEGAAEAELVERFRRGLVLVLRRRSGDPALAEDLAQETLALVLEKVRSGAVNEPERLAGFVHGTARHLLFAHRRKSGRLVALDPARDQDPGGERPRAEEVRQAGPDQLDELVRREDARLVRHLLGELAVSRDREVLFRFYLSDEPREVICRRLGIDPGHFRRVLFRARERLRQLWTEHQEGAGWDGSRRGDTSHRGAD